MANKFVAVFLMCIVVAAALHVREAVATGDDEFRSCFNTCQQECKAEGNGNTFCEMKCDSNCLAKEAAAKLDIKFPNLP